MTNLATTYLGLNLSSPIIVGSSRLTSTAKHIKECADAGAGAVVMKSLFEEQIIGEHVDPATQDSMGYHTEALEYVTQMSMAYGPEQYLNTIREACALVDIPIIASINALHEEYWVEFAKKVESAGAAAIELNISHISSDSKTEPKEIEQRYVDIVKQVKKSVSIPVAVKLGDYFTSIPNIVRKLEFAGADAVVLFNRFYQMDVDVEKMEITPGYTLSSRTNMTQSLRWVSIISGQAKLDVCGSRGIYTGEDVVKHLLVGAKAIQVTSVLLRNGKEHISAMSDEISAWMERKNYDNIDKFIGKFAQSVAEDPELYEREQYIKAYVGIE
ncbi:dihydroorotate dehydrogenase-like protein [bacterium]|nr:dihydroorotate dehydrogenase-like protein [bacterium]